MIEPIEGGEPTAVRLVIRIDHLHALRALVEKQRRSCRGRASAFKSLGDRANEVVARYDMNAAERLLEVLSTQDQQEASNDKL